MRNEEIYEELEGTTNGEVEQKLASIYITSERLKDWIGGTKEGKAINQQIMLKYERGFEAFERCSPTDVEGLQKARMEIEVALAIKSMFTAIYNEGAIAEERLKQD
jgi:hypothetical protein